MRDAYEDRTSVGEQFIDTVRDCDADGIGTEVVVIDAHRCAAPLGAMVFEVADQFSFFGVDADDGQPCRRSGYAVTRCNGTVGRGAGTAVGELCDSRGVRNRYREAAGHGIGRDLNIELAQQFGDSGRRLVGPSNAGDGIAGGVVFQQAIDAGFDYLGASFPLAFRRRRRRTGPGSTSPSAALGGPGRRWGIEPQIRPSWLSPPWPI